MDTRSRLIAVADLYIEATGLKPSTVSLRAFGHTSKLDAMRNGSDILSEYADGGFHWFAANWPEGEQLPAILSEWLKINPPKGLQSRAVSSTDLQPATAVSEEQV